MTIFDHDLLVGTIIDAKVMDINEVEKLVNLDQLAKQRLLCAIEEYEKLAAFHQASPGRVSASRLHDADHALKSVADQQTYEGCTSELEKRCVFDRQLISAVVATENAYSPEVDPNVGWLRIAVSGIDQSEISRLHVNTQLLDAILEPKRCGAVKSLTFKPRKVALVSQLNEEISTLFCYPHLGNVSDPGHTNYKLMRHTPDNAVLRFTTTWESCPMTYCCDYQFKSGLGAYRNNSTTGLRYDFWLENCGDNPPSVTINIGATLLLPSATPLGISVQNLLPGGGCASESTELDHLVTFEPTNGIRLTDGLNSFVVDLRLAREITRISAEPFFMPDGSYVGTHLDFTVSVQAIRDIDHANSIHLSL